MSPSHNYTDDESLRELDRKVWEHVDRNPKAGDLAYPDSSLEIKRSSGAEGYYEVTDGETSIEVNGDWIFNLEEMK